VCVALATAEAAATALVDRVASQLIDRPIVACANPVTGILCSMATKKAASKKTAKKSTGNQTSTDQPVQGGLGSKPVTEVSKDQPTGSDSPYAS
jgi:hypothetical protein